ncbi:hypothetical protein [Spirosoma linguale]|uniref:Uncharacterized protein n=1 Tax=Spirosoma linguale (strain ATCC 33905 / DSM 74 / LMG 10896 / Claus 1) TaxID=504472 RepID=D2QQA2_SPILD|nr:hypothetical protein Slin_3528 [Spirosoma linguale DSM 74]
MIFKINAVKGVLINSRLESLTDFMINAVNLGSGLGKRYRLVSARFNWLSE